MSTQTFSHASFFSQLKRYYSFYTGGFLLFLGALAVAEQMGMSRAWIGYWFLAATIGLYAGIGWMTRTTDVAEYYVAGRRVPAFFNGMATGADWMSAASFIGMAEAASPSHDPGEPVIAGQEQCPRHADERRGAHPVGASRHAIEKCRHPASCDVIFRDIRGAGHPADAGVQADGREQEL